MRRLLLCAALLSAPAATAAEPAPPILAVAASFAAPARELIAASPLPRARLVSASTGKLAAEILHGAPYALFVSADPWRPQRLLDSGRARYCRPLARGVLALWSRTALDEPAALAGDPPAARIAIASPQVAPYGAAARDWLRRAGLWEAVQPRLLRAQSAAQAMQFALSGHAEHAFVSLAQARLAPSGHHLELGPDAALDHRLCRLAGADADTDLLEAFLLGPAAGAMLRAHGYRSPEIE